MANASSGPLDTPSSSAPSEDVGSKAMKRYECLIMLRTKAIEGKGGAWYWTYFEPILTKISETNLPKAAKLKCTLCGSTFSASNPSRTATEHLKKGTCPNFTSLLPPLSQNHHHHRKRSFTLSSSSSSSSSSALYPLQRNLVLSGGKADFSALAMLEDSVKKLKRPKSIPVPSLTPCKYIPPWIHSPTGSTNLTGQFQFQLSNTQNSRLSLTKSA